MEGIWETVSKGKLPVDDNDKTNAFVFKVPEHSFAGGQW